MAEETTGRVSQIGPTGHITPVFTGLTSPEGIAFDDSGDLYVVEDTQAGRLMRRTPAGLTTALATDLDAPEGVAWAALDMLLYVTESNIQFVTNPAHLRTRIAAVSPSGTVSRIVTNTPTIQGTDVAFWSYAGLAVGPGGLLYVTNEISGREITHTVVVTPGVLTVTLTLYTTDSIFAVDPTTGQRTLFASDLTSPEGLRFSSNGDFPLYVAEEDVGGGTGRLSRVESDGSHTPLCTGFFGIEDVAVDRKGWLYVSEDTSGLVVLIKHTAQHGLTVVPSTDTRSGDPGATVTYTLQATNTGNISDTFDVRASGYSWVTTAGPATVGPLAAGGRADVVVTVAIPASAAAGAADVATVTVTSQGDDTVTAAATLTTTANTVYGLMLTPTTDTRFRTPGATVTYTLQVVNSGNVSDTFDVRASGYSWATAADPATVGPLVAGGSADVLVTVAIPASAAAGATDVATVTVTSQGDGTKTATSTLTTTAGQRRVFLPLITQ